MCIGGSPATPTPPPVVMSPPPDNSAQLNSLTMQNQALQDQINEMALADTSDQSQLQQQVVAAEAIRQRQMAADTRGTDASDELKRGKRGRSSLRIRRRPGGTGRTPSPSVNLPSSGGGKQSKTKGTGYGTNLPS